MTILSDVDEELLKDSLVWIINVEVVKKDVALDLVGLLRLNKYITATTMPPIFESKILSIKHFDFCCFWTNGVASLFRPRTIVVFGLIVKVSYCLLTRC